jgi:hypothetical protein
MRSRDAYGPRTLGDEGRELAERVVRVVGVHQPPQLMASG